MGRIRQQIDQPLALDESGQVVHDHRLVGGVFAEPHRVALLQDGGLDQLASADVEDDQHFCPKDLVEG